MACDKCAGRDPTCPKCGPGPTMHRPPETSADPLERRRSYWQAHPFLALGVLIVIGTFGAAAAGVVARVVWEMFVFGWRIVP